MRSRASPRPFEIDEHVRKGSKEADGVGFRARSKEEELYDITAKTFTYHITVTWYGFDYTHLSCNLYILFLTIDACELQLARRFFMILPFSYFYRSQFLWTEERLAFDEAIGDNVETACISFDIIPSKMALSSISSLSRNMQDTWPIRD